MTELADVKDLKSFDVKHHEGSSPSAPTKNMCGFAEVKPEEGCEKFFLKQGYNENARDMMLALIPERYKK